VPFSPAEKSTLLAVVTMANEYRIKPDGPQFLIIDQTGKTVGVYKTEREAKDGIAVCMSDDAMWDSARLLAEAVPWRCHRPLIGDALIVRGIRVEHIMSETLL
jgi:hypothetical protein